MTEAKTQSKRGRPPNEGMRQRILKLYESGWSQKAIADELELSPDSVRQYLRYLGVAARKVRVFEGHDITVRKEGEQRIEYRVCALCDEDKPVSEYRNRNHRVCRPCRYAEGWDKT